MRKPILVLAPMVGVTDIAFRQIVAKYGKPDVLWTEFISCDGLCSPGREALLEQLAFEENERPILAQFFGAKPENYYRCAQLAAELKFDGIDINMGCPDKAVLKQGCGAALVNRPELAKEIILATKEGAPHLPVSVKIRTGFNTVVIEEWVNQLLDVDPVAITVHGRTKKEMSAVPARWDLIAKAKQVALARGKDTLVLGNGDVKSLQEAHEKASLYGLDGVMIGRGIFGNPWLFNPSERNISISEKLRVMVEHTELFERYFQGRKSFALMKKFYKCYVTGFRHAKDLRIALMETETAAEVAAITTEFLRTTPLVAEE